MLSDDRAAAGVPLGTGAARSLFAGGIRVYAGSAWRLETISVLNERALGKQ